MDLKDIVTFARLNGGSVYCPTGLGFATIGTSTTAHVQWSLGL